MAQPVLPEWSGPQLIYINEWHSELEARLQETWSLAEAPF